ncbi:hypothetical protein C2G38_2032325 [Gigaspora rosea]|uniref:Uncharacterized protein n=1 Tax=Gigaspora rosea TaxID=44941 RepID=A0A397VN19_9GLOM|nr:hypothetical protein C2G38_2032325 [Gigaspora rosea]
MHWFVKNADDLLSLNYETWLTRECQLDIPPKDSMEAYNRWSRKLIEAKRHVKMVANLHNLEKAEISTRSMGKKRERIFNYFNKKFQNKCLSEQWVKDFRKNVEEMQEAMRLQASRFNNDERQKLEQVVNAFVKTKLGSLHFSSPSVIGVLDTTNSKDPTFSLLNSESRSYFKKITIEDTVFSIADKLAQKFVNTYKNENWEFCNDVPFEVPEALQCRVSKQDESYAFVLTSMYPDHGMDSKDPPENHITITQTGHLIDEFLFSLDVPYILT